MKTINRLSILSALAVTLATPAYAQLQEGEKPTAEQIAAGEAPAQRFSEAETVYRGLQGTMVPREWTPQAGRDLAAYIDRVGAEGFVPADYAPERIRAALESRDKAALNFAATDSFLRLSADLALGALPISVRDDWHMKDPDLEGAQQFALIERIGQGEKVSDVLNSLLPTHPQYAELKGVLARAEDASTREKARVNLERWRWLPRDLGPRYVIVNVPAYTAALVENGGVVARHRAVVGSTRTPTPQLSAVATGVILNPWWEIPKSIEPEVRGKKGYVKVATEGGGSRYRQPPGPGNSLGRMKVVMPNNYAIYLHDTPSKALFSKPDRAASHGCIRTQDALGFARVLLDNPEWDKAAIDAQIASGKTVQAKATVATPVYIAYFTAAAAKNDAGIVTYKDVYGRDKKVIAAMNAKAKPTLASR